MTKISAGEARSRFSEVINRARYSKERVAVTSRGKTVAVIVPVEDAELLEEIEDRIDLEEARKALAESKRKGTIPWKKVKAELGL